MADRNRDVIDLTGSDSLPTRVRPSTRDGIDLNRETLRRQETSDGDAVSENEEDEDLRRAIALSLEECEVEKVVTGEEGSEEMVEKKGKQVNSGSGAQARKSAILENKDEHAVVRSGDGGGSGILLALDRKAMEAERLARLKRKRDLADEGSQGAIPQAAVDPKATRLREISPPLLKRHSTTRKADLPSSSSEKQAKGIKPSQEPTQPLKGSLTKLDADHNTVATTLHPNGIVLKTYASNYLPDRTISFPDLIGPSSQLQSCLLSSFIWDFDWLLPHFNTKSTNFLLVMHAKYASEKSAIQRDFAGVKNVRLCFPNMEGQVNCMHSKLMLLFYGSGSGGQLDRDGGRDGAIWTGGRCRIVVPTANLTGVDWGVGGVMENMVWLMDLPLLSKNKVGETTTSFQMRLMDFLKAQDVPEEVIQKLKGYDFAMTANVGLVHSIGGSHSDESWRDTGHCGLGRVVREMGLATQVPLEIDFVTSSLGNLKDEFLRSMYLACQGDDGSTELTRRLAKSFPAANLTKERSVVNREVGAGWKAGLRIYFPSQKTVDESNGKAASAGTICFNRNWWQSSKFPRENMRDCVSGRHGLLMHNKVMFVRPTHHSQSTQDQHYNAWVYVGSANLSESAWGRLVLDKSTRTPKLGCRNWEIGIILRISDRVKAEGLELDIGCLNDMVPVPMTVPACKYNDAGKEPWFFRPG